MPTHCCVPLCTRKGYRDEETGEKVSYFKFPTEERLKKLWIYAIRRDEGKNFQVSKYILKVLIKFYRFNNIYDLKFLDKEITAL